MRTYTRYLGFAALALTANVSIRASAYAVDPPATNSLGTGRAAGFSGVLSVDSVVRKSGVVTVKGTIKNSDKSTRSVSNCTGSYLLDPEKGIKYEVLEDEKGKPVGFEGVQVSADAQRPLWCKFPAPPAEVKTIGYVHTEFEAIEDLPITDK